MKRARSFFALTLLLIFFFSCSKSHSGTDTTNSGSSGSNTQGPLFTAVKTVTTANCAVSGCHAGSSPASGLDFSNNSTIVTQKDRIKVRAVDQAGTPNQMPQPPRASLSAADQKKITDWIATGGRLTD